MTAPHVHPIRLVDPSGPSVRSTERAPQELLGEAEVRGRRALVRWQGATLDGDPELIGRITRVAGRTPGTPTEFLRALRSVGGRMRAVGATVSSRSAEVSLTASRGGSPLLDA